jgi:DNA-directed RNA polymerase subunit K/omega
MTEKLVLPYPETDEEATRLFASHKVSIDRMNSDTEIADTTEAQNAVERSKVLFKIRSHLGRRARRINMEKTPITGVYRESAFDNMVRAAINKDTAKIHYDEHADEYFENAKAEAEADGVKIHTEAERRE